MKVFKILFGLFISLVSIQSYGQNDCANSLPFCAGASGYTFPAGTSNTSAAAGPNYGCLYSQPNPAWYYVQIAQSGPVTLLATGSAGGDVDVIAWGPFSSPTGNCGNLTAGNIISCDYGTSATGTIVIANAQAGQYYQVLITNYLGTQQNINFNQTSGSGSTNCNFTAGVNSQTICPAQTATLVATSTVVNPTYLWSPGGATTQSITVSPAVTTVYSCTITGAAVAGGPINSSVKTGTVTLAQTPTVVVSSNSDVCPNSAIFLNATSGFTNYVWTTPAGTQTTTVNSLSIPNATTNLMGTYSVTVNSAQGCPGTGTTTVNMINTSPVTATIPPSACEGGTVSLTASAVGAASYSWIGPGGYTSSLQNPQLNSVTMAQNGIYTVTASFTAAVGNSTCTTVTTTTVTVIPASTVALTPLSTICNGGIINLTAPGGGNSYNWAGPNNFVSSLQNPSINNAEINNQGVYSVSITASGCVRTGSINVDVYNVLSYSSVPTDVTLCEGKTAVLSATGAGGSGTYNYSWNPANDLSDGSSPNPLATAVTIPSMQYTLTLSDANCAVTKTVQTVVTVSVNPTPVISFGKDLRGCEPFSAPIESSSVPTSTNCSWAFSNSTASGQCGTSTGFLFPLHGSYDATLTVVDVNGCTSTSLAPAYVIVDPVPVADFSYLPLNPTVLINEVSFTDNSTIGTPMDSLRWNFGDYFQTPAQNIDSIPNPSHIYDNAATYTVTLIVTNKFGCKVYG